MAVGLFAAEAPSPSTSPSHTLTNARVAHWAPVLRRIAAHRAPSATSPVLTRIPTVTPERTQNIVLVLTSVDIPPSEKWYEVRLPILPNNSTGWVPRRALGNLYKVRTHLYVNRERFTAALKRDGRTIFTARVGVGRPSTPTPRGQFYVRDELAGFGVPFFGPIVFGTNGRSAVLTEWPGGGFIGIHGTNRPGILPGAVSHGCIRMVNRDIRRLAKLMSIGTPLTIT